MARIFGPLLSGDARGNWGYGALQFRGGLHATHAYRPARPGAVNQAPATAAQNRIRQRYRAAIEDWHALDPGERDGWNASAEPMGLSGWNLFLQTLLVVPAVQSTPALLAGRPPRLLPRDASAPTLTLHFRDFTR